MKRSAGNVLINLGVLIAYFASAKLGLSLASANPSATAVWPPTGIALTAALLLGQRIWPAIWLGALFANYTVSHDVAAWVRLWTSAGIATGNVLESVVGAFLVNQFAGGRRVFDRAGDIFRYVLYAALLATAISASVGVTVLELGHLAKWEHYGAIWLTWWLGDVVSALTVAPLLIIWITSPLPKAAIRLEAALMLIAMTVATYVVFGPLLPPRTPVGYVALMTLLWAAFRFYQHGAATSIFIYAGIAVWGSLLGYGPFGLPDRNSALLYLQSYLASISVMMLVLSASVWERELAKGDAERANKTKDEFLAVLSHELRTPLTPALLTVSLLEQHAGMPAEALADLKIIRRNIELEARLIDDLLDVTRIARGKLQLNIETTDLHAAVKGAVQICANGNANIDLDLSADQSLVRGDSARLQQVFWNLLSNAQKFTPAPERIFIRSSNPMPGRIRVEVRDSGIGIDPAVLPRLFNAFEQGAIGTARKYGGLGLGLAICKALIAAHEGTLSAASEGAGKGATFTVELATV